MNRPRIAAIVLAVALTSGCVSDKEYRELVAAEQEVESIREELEAIPVRTPQEESQLARARATEGRLEDRLASAEQYTKEAWMSRGIEAGRRGILTDWEGLLGMLGTLVTGTGILYVNGRSKKRDKEDRDQLRQEQAERLAEQDSRQALDLAAKLKERDDSRVLQGMAAASDRSASQGQSAVALAAKDIQERAAQLVAQRAIAQQMAAQRAGELTGSLAPRVSTEDFLTALQSEPGAN